MTTRMKLTNVLYISGLVIMIISGILIRASAPVGLGVFLFYKSRFIIPVNITDDKGLFLNKISLLWPFFFLSISVLFLFSLTKTIAGILFSGQTVVISKWVLPLSAIESIFYEILYRAGLTIINRIAAILLVLVFIQSAGSYILGGFLIYSDLILGFLSFLITAIMSSGKVYSELSDIFS